LPPDESKQGFTLLGFFRTNGPVSDPIRASETDPPVVTTYQRTTYERSQLAIRSVYIPRESDIGETFMDANGRMLQPQEQSVDFLYGYPRSPTDSPYPEKAIAAFYLGIGTDPSKTDLHPENYLSDELKPSYSQNSWGLGLTPDLISRVLITSISYTPDREAELAHLRREVTVVVSPVKNENNQRQPPRRITWELVGIPIPGEQDCEWRLDKITSTIVTDGLGYLPTPSLAETAALVR
ncbi:MAG: hypothetical protein H0T73_08925, partial [Ardenticatenales bacterium]|nr:hypothetical protein [Ardenticatenales bacterium]